MLTWHRRDSLISDSLSSHCYPTYLYVAGSVGTCTFYQVLHKIIGNYVNPIETRNSYWKQETDKNQGCKSSMAFWTDFFSDGLVIFVIL